MSLAESDYKFVAVAATDAIAPGSVIKVEVDRLCIAIYNIDGTFYATDEICSHAQASLAEGFIIDDAIECPLHGACFSIKTGEPLSAPATEPIQTYAVRIESGQVLVAIPRARNNRE